MRHVHSLVPLLALALSVTPVHAYTYGPYGCDIRWDQCFGDGGAQNKNFACDTNAGSELLVASFVPAWDIVDVSGLEIVIDFVSDSATLPAWWAFKNAGTCRLSSLVFNSVGSPVAVNCPDWAGGNAVGGIGAYNIGSGSSPNTARLKIATAVPPSLLRSLTGRSEYFGCSLAIDHAKTVGTGSCAGCATPVCVVFQGVRMTTPILANDRYLTGPSNLTDSDFAMWQGGGAPVVGGKVGCPQAVPTRKSTWGTVKALYR